MSKLDLHIIDSMETMHQLIMEKDAILIYFSHDECNVCKVLKPKVKELLDSAFPKIDMTYVDTVKNPEIAGQLSIFTVPTILVYFGGKEYIRVSRNIGIPPLADQIRRPYELMFG